MKSKKTILLLITLFLCNVFILSVKAQSGWQNFSSVVGDQITGCTSVSGSYFVSGWPFGVNKLNPTNMAVTAANSGLPSAISAGVGFQGITSNSNSGKLWVYNYSSIYESTNLGGSWNQLTTPTPSSPGNQQLTFLKNEGDVLFCAFGWELFYSNDGGITWILPTYNGSNYFNFGDVSDVSIDFNDCYISYHGYSFNGITYNGFAAFNFNQNEINPVTPMGSLLFSNTYQMNRFFSGQCILATDSGLYSANSNFSTFNLISSPNNTSITSISFSQIGLSDFIGFAADGLGNVWYYSSINEQWLNITQNLYTSASGNNIHRLVNYNGIIFTTENSSGIASLRNISNESILPVWNNNILISKPKVCIGDTLKAYFTNPTSTAITQYQWSATGSAVANTNSSNTSFDIVPNAQGNLIISVAITYSGNPVAINYTINAQAGTAPSITVPSIDAVCIAGPANVLNCTTSNANGVLWHSTPCLTPTNIANPTIVLNNPVGLYTIIVEAFNAYCAVKDSTKLYYTNGIGVSAGSPVHLCIGTPLYLAGGNDLSGIWDNNPYVYWEDTVMVNNVNDMYAVATLPTVPGVYPLTLKSTIGNCPSYSDVIITTVLPDVQAAITLNGNILTASFDTCNNYMWYLDGVLLPDTTQQISISQSGAYTVNFGLCNLAGFCSTLSDPILVTNSFALSKNNYKIYPQPAFDMVYIDNINATDKIELVDINGKTIKIKSKHNNSNKVEIDISSLSAGFYLFQIVTSGGELSRLKFIKN